MKSRYKYLPPLALWGAFALTACNSAQSDWTNASTENTVPDYQAFLEKHPKDERVQEAQTRIAALQDEAAWKTAQGDNSPISYQAYLQAEPNGTHAQAARDEITQGPEADQARQKLAAIRSDYRAELGSFRNERSARRRRSDLQTKFSKVLVEIDVVAPDSAGKKFRVMSGLMNRQDADSACTSIKRDHQPCEVVKDDQRQG
jgi:hypothetical protein